MNIGILLPGFSSDERDYAIPVQSHLAQLLSAQDDVRLIALRYPHRVDTYRAFGAEVHSLGFGQARGVKRIRLWMRAMWQIAYLHGQRPFDVLHAMWADETGLLAAWAGRRLGIPSVVSPLGGEFSALRDIDYGAQRTAFGRWITGQALRADRVVMPSRFIHEQMKRAGYVVPDERIVDITLGVDTILFTPLQLRPEPRHLIHVASLVPVKDQVTLLNAVALLDEVTLDIVGAGKEEPSLRYLASDLGISKRLTFHGSVNYLELPGYYRRAGIKVLTSRHEANCIAALEAGACGLPVVTTAVGRMPEYPDMAITVPVGDDEALAAAIRLLIDDPARYESMRRAARERAVAEFDNRWTAERLRALYRGLQ